MSTDRDFRHGWPLYFLDLKDKFRALRHLISTMDNLDEISGVWNGAHNIWFTWPTLGRSVKTSCTLL